jgi:hypothetical protein
MNRHSSTVLALAVGLMLLVGTAAFALPAYRADRISTQGTITSVTRVGDQYQVSLNHGAYSYYVPVAMVQNHDIRVGDQVRLGGIITGDTVTTDYVAFSGTPAYARDPSYQGVPYGQSGWLSATVIRPHQHYGYLEVRDDASGLPMKIDVRKMDEKHSVNVWRAQTGDHINVLGSWENRETFRADRVVY